MITIHLDSLQCKKCSKIPDNTHTRGLLEPVFDNESGDIIGLKCPDCENTYTFQKPEYIKTFRYKSCGEIFLSDIGKDLCSSCDHNN